MEAQAYLDAHGVEATLKSAVAGALRSRPDNPIAFICEHLLAAAAKSSAADSMHRRLIAESYASMTARLEPSPELPLYDGSPAKTMAAALVELPSLMAGVWTCTPDIYEEKSYEVDELMVLLSGQLKLTEADGTSRVLVKDDVFFIPKGWCGRWDILETISKLYVIMPELPTNLVAAGPAIMESYSSMVARLQEKKVDYTKVKTTISPLVERPGLKAGVWTCERDGWDEQGYEVDELMVMLNGRLKLTEADGTSRELIKDDVFFIPKGWCGRWEILEAMSKLYVILEEK